MSDKTKVILHYENEAEKFAVIKIANDLNLSWIQQEGKLVVYTENNQSYIAIVKAKQHAHK